MTLPRKLAVNGTINLVLEAIQTHATYPYPAQATQADPQLLKYDAELFVLSPYTTLVQRTKVKCVQSASFFARDEHMYRSPSPDIPSYSTPSGVDGFVGDASVTKSGAVITYGPFHSVGPSATTEFLSDIQQVVSVQYNYDHPVLEVTKLQRSAEISHWGSNLNIEDRIDLHNAGPL